MGVMRLLAFLFILSFPNVLSLGWAQAPRPANSPNANPLRAMSLQFEQLAERVEPGIVQIFTRGLELDKQELLLRPQRGSGSGLVVDKDGYIVTNAHVIGSARRVQVLLPLQAQLASQSRSVLKPHGKMVSAEVVGLDRETDIAVLKVPETNLTPLVFADSEAVRQGQLVFAFGSPFGLENSVTMGVVSFVARQVRTDDPMIYIQTDAAINPGNSGGPLVDSEGHVVGINTYILSPTGVNDGIGFAAPSNIVKSVYEQIRQHGRVKRGQIGVVAQTITPPLAEALKLHRDVGVLISDVTPGGSASAAGLELRDIVLKLNGKEMENARQFGVNIYANAGKTIQLQILRGEKTMDLGVAVLERPRDPERILDLLSGPTNRITPLGILAVDLDDKATPLLPTLRKLTGIVVAGVIADLSLESDNRLRPGDVIHEVNGNPVDDLAQLKVVLGQMKHGQPAALQIERQGQLQFLVVEID
jgi:serine protease Do